MSSLKDWNFFCSFLYLPNISYGTECVINICCNGLNCTLYRGEGVARPEDGGFSINPFVTAIQSLPHGHQDTALEACPALPFSPPTSAQCPIRNPRSAWQVRLPERPRILCPVQLGTATNLQPESTREPLAGSHEKGIRREGWVPGSGRQNRAGGG